MSVCVKVTKYSHSYAPPSPSPHPPTLSLVQTKHPSQQMLEPPSRTWLLCRRCWTLLTRRVPLHLPPPAGCAGAVYGSAAHAPRQRPLHRPRQADCPASHVDPELYHLKSEQDFFLLRARTPRAARTGCATSLCCAWPRSWSASMTARAWCFQSRCGTRAAARSIIPLLYGPHGRRCGRSTPSWAVL